MTCLIMYALIYLEHPYIEFVHTNSHSLGNSCMQYLCLYNIYDVFNYVCSIVSSLEIPVFSPLNSACS
jgi:hypothetical protein